jgi:hypothetical protein
MQTFRRFSYREAVSKNTKMTEVVDQDTSLINERRGAVTAHDDIALVLAGRERKLSFDIPSLSLRAIELKKKIEKHKYKAFYPEIIMKEKLTALQPLPNRPKTPNTLRIAKEKDEKQKKHLTSFIDHFMQSGYCLTKPRRVLVKDRDFLHLLGEVNGSRYNYCGRPELELFIIGMESPDYYQQSYHNEVRKEENLSSFSSRSRTPNRPISAISRPISASITASSLGKIDESALVSSLNELDVAGTNEIFSEEQLKKEDRRSSIQPSTAVIPVSSGNAAEALRASQSGNETPSTPSHLALQQHIIPHRILTLSYDYKTNYNMKTISLLYDPSKCLIIMSEKTEIELVQLLMESYQHNLQAEERKKLKKEKEEREKKEKEEGITIKNDEKEVNALEENMKEIKALDKKEEKKESLHNKRKTTRQTTLKKKKVALFVDDKHATTTDEESESEKRPKSAFTAQRIEDNLSIYGDKITELILLQCFYYIGNDETIHTFDKERITLWKRFYSKYLLPFFISFLSAYSYHYSMINNVLRERMNQIDHHIEINIHRSILDDSQSEDSDSFDSRDGKKKHRKATKRTLIQHQQQQQPTRSSIAISADLKKKQRMIQSFQQSSENNPTDNLPLHSKSASIIVPNKALKTISLKKNDVIHAAIAQAVQNVNNADSEKEEDDEDGEDGNQLLDIRRRNNIKPIFIPKDSQNSKKKKPSLLSLSASSDQT